MQCLFDAEIFHAGVLVLYDETPPLGLLFAKDPEERAKVLAMVSRLLAATDDVRAFQLTAAVMGSADAATRASVLSSSGRFCRR